MTDGDAPPVRGHLALRRFTFVIVLLATTCSEQVRDGPLVAVTPSGQPAVPYSTSRAVAVLQPFTFSAVLIRNPSDRPATLDDVELIDGSDQISVVGAMVGRFRGGADDFIDGSPTYPPGPEITATLQPIRGYELEPNPGDDRAAQIFVGLLAERGSAGVFEGVAVDYLIGEEEFRLVIPVGLRACAPPRDFRGTDAPRCDAPPLQPPVE
jgi:hypothetical protein